MIWRFKVLGVTEEQLSKEDRDVLKRYQLGARTLSRKEHYNMGVYIKEVENVIAYRNENELEIEKPTQITMEAKRKNQLLLSKEEIEKMKS